MKVYVDGACSGNPGMGGWAVIMCDEKGMEFEESGSAAHTTNNQMELMAAIQGLTIAPKNVHIDIYTDSKYVANGITQWIAKWRKNNWMTAGKSPVKNKDLWEQLDKLMQEKDVSWHWVRGHNGHHYNERVDKLAKNAIVALRLQSL